MPFIKIKRPDKASIVLFLLPILTIFTINIVGQLMFSDIVVTLLTPMLLFSRNINKKQPYLKKIMFLLLLWLFSVIASDMINETSFEDLLRGVAAIIFFALHIFVIFVLVDGKRERLTAIILGTSISFILLLFFAGEVYSFDDGKNTPWKMGVGFGVTLLFIMILGVWLKRERSKAKILLLFSPIHLFLNARSLFLTLFLAAFISAFQIKVHSKKKRFFIILGILFSVFFVAPIVMSSYGKLNQEGFFGTQAQEKYLMQTAGGKINIILAGRTEVFISVVAITDSPFIGHGSWATSKKYYKMYLIMLKKMGKDINWENALSKERYLIPAHSMLLSAWVYHGFIGSLFWFYILFLSLKSLSIGMVGKKQLQLRDMVIVVILIWDIFFSPFGQARRCIEVVYILVVCMILTEDKKQINKKGKFI